MCYVKNTKIISYFFLELVWFTCIPSVLHVSRLFQRRPICFPCLSIYTLLYFKINKIIVWSYHLHVQNLIMALFPTISNSSLSCLPKCDLTKLLFCPPFTYIWLTLVKPTSIFALYIVSTSPCSCFSHLQDPSILFFLPFQIRISLHSQASLTSTDSFHHLLPKLEDRHSWK